MCQLAVWDLMVLVIGVRLTDDSELHTRVNVVRTVVALYVVAL